MLCSGNHWTFGAHFSRKPSTSSTVSPVSNAILRVVISKAPQLVERGFVSKYRKKSLPLGCRDSNHGSSHVAQSTMRYIRGTPLQ